MKVGEREMEEIIISVINLHNGIRSTDLALAVMSQVNPQRFCTETYENTMRRLIEQGEIRTFEYAELERQSKINIMYFTGKTRFIEANMW